MKKPIIFIQEAPPYKFQTVVACDATREDISGYLRKQKVRESFRQMIVNDDKVFKIFKNSGGLFSWTALGGLMMLKNPQSTMDFMGVLSHEVHHMVYFLSKDRGILDSTEAQAYLYEYLFMEITNKIFLPKR